MAEKMVAKLDAQNKRQAARGRRTSDRGAYSRFTRAVAEAKLSRFIKADLQVDCFIWSLDEQAIARAELFHGKLALLTNAPDLTPAETVTHYKALVDIERGFRVLKSDIEIAPVHHRSLDRIRAHTPKSWRTSNQSSYSTRSSLPDPIKHHSYRRSYLQRHQQNNSGATRPLRCPEPPQTGLKFRCHHKRDFRVININHLRD